MRASVLNHTGGPDVLTVSSVDDVHPSDTQVVVRVRACGICGHDTADRAGTAAVALPVVLGHEIAGEIVELGSAVRGLDIGQRVASKQLTACGRCAACRRGDDVQCAGRRFVYGGAAEYAALESNTVLPVPDSVGDAAAAIASCAVGTSVQALERIAKLRSGETVLVTGAGGGLGLHALQVAKAMGARVFALTSSPGKADRLRTHGADEVVIAGANTTAEVLELTAGQGVQVVLDNVGSPEVFDSAYRGLARRGRYVLTGQLKRAKISVYPYFVFSRETVITGSQSTTMSSFMRAMSLLDSGEVRAVVETFDLDGVAEAHRRVDASSVTGRAVLAP